MYSHVFVVMPAQAGIQKMPENTGFPLALKTAPAFSVLPPSLAVARE
jgi:hypothetical protein